MDFIGYQVQLLHIADQKMRPREVKQLAEDPPRVSTGIQWSLLDSKH